MERGRAKEKKGLLPAGGVFIVDTDKEAFAIADFCFCGAGKRMTKSTHRRKIVVLLG